MRKTLLFSGLAVALSVMALPREASASPITSCSTGTLNVCAAFDASTSYVSGHWHLILKVWNLYDGTAANGQTSVITFAGIGSSWTGTASLVSAKYNGNTVSWSQVTNINNNVVGAQLDFAANGSNGINNGLIGCNQTGTATTQLKTCYPSGPELVLDFQTSSEFNLTGAVEGWHAQAINGTQCSGWFATDGSSTLDAATAADCSSVVPEPITMTLLGTGLAGLGGAGFLRRRRRGLEVSDG